MQTLIYKTELFVERAPAWLAPNSPVELRRQADGTVVAFARRPSHWFPFWGEARPVRIGVMNEEVAMLLSPVLEAGITLRVRIVELHPAHLTTDRLARISVSVYLCSFGEITVPLHLWRALVRFDAWIEPALVAEWVRVMEGYAEGQGRRLDPGVVARAMAWADPRRDGGFARCRALTLLEEHDLHCVWTGRKLTGDRLDIDHCLPWAVWPCEDLWNLMPSSPAVNRHGKRDRLPAPDLLERSEDRILSWWERAWVSNPGTADRFTAEAKASLPVPGGREDLGAIFMGVEARRFAIRADQLVAEWAPA